MGRVGGHYSRAQIRFWDCPTRDSDRGRNGTDNARLDR